MSEKSTLVIIKSCKNHFWQSCQIIENQILAALNSSDLESNILEIDEDFSLDQLDWLKNLNSKEISFFFLSDVLVYQKLCESLLQLDQINLKFYFPIYGNMTMEIYRWLSLDKILKGKNVFFLGASLRSCQQIARFLNDSTVYCLPFCYEASPFLLQEKNREPTIDLVYAGRITPQKNILELIDCFTEAYKFNPNLRLHIAGSLHDRGYHLHGYSVSFEMFKADFEKRILNPGIIYHGSLEQEELLELYRKSNYFISMSTYHDEDFGMSACQAALSGLGLILSDWGGHSSFVENSTFIPVNVDSYNLPRISNLALIKKLMSLRDESFDNDFYKKYFSYESYVDHLKNLLKITSNPFNGLSDLYFKYAEACLKGFPFFNPKQTIKSKKFYLSIYDSYLRDKGASDQSYRID